MRSERQLNQESTEVQDAQQARNEEVLQLGEEVLHLREQLQSCSSVPDMSGSKHASSNALGVGITASGRLKEHHIQLETELIKAAIELEQLHKQLMKQREQMELARQQKFQAMREAAGHRARLAVAREVNAQEMAQLRQRFLPSPRQPSDLERPVSAEATLNLQSASELDEVEAALTSDRAAQQQERAMLEQELHAMHVKADKESSASSRIDENLARQCAALHARASEILHGLGAEQPLPDLPSSGVQDLGDHSDWLEALAAGFEMVLRRSTSVQ